MDNLSDGFQIGVNFYNCKCEDTLLYDSTSIEDTIETIIVEADLTVLKKSFYKFHGDFEQNGFTGTYVLAESDVVLHSWPEIKRMDVGIYVCNVSKDNTDKAKQVYTKLKEMFKPSQQSYMEFHRGLNIEEVV